MKKELSKREQKRLEQITQENIQKFDEEYKKSRIIPKDYKKKILNRILKNFIYEEISYHHHCRRAGFCSGGFHGLSVPAHHPAGKHRGPGA